MLIEPRDPLIVRDGRPFTSSPGARARSLPFPLPQTLAGAIRTRIGLTQGWCFPEDAAKARQIGIRGPLLVERQGEDWQPMAPAPADAVLLSGAKRTCLYRLLPLDPGQGVQTNLPEGLYPVGIPHPDSKSKPLAMPRFWSWATFERWLDEPPLQREVARETLGHDGPVGEMRTHLKLNPKTQTAEEGYLFQTSGLEFVRKIGGSPRRLALALWVEGAPNGLFPLGGERRLALWQEQTLTQPEPPPGLLERLKQHRAARVIFLTPGAFAEDYLPRGRRLRGASIEAVALGRSTVASGWDLERHEAKPSRRLVPSGSVYFVRFPDWSEVQIETWLKEVWMQNLSDEVRDRLDGYGLAVVGSWTGKLEVLEV